MWTFRHQRTITIFLRQGFKDIVAQKDLKPNWPGPDTIQELSTLAKGLFMWAKVVVEFITDGVPSKQLGADPEGEECS